MKTTWAALGLLILSSLTTPAQPKPDQDAKSVFSVSDRGPHHKIMERIEYEPAIGGKTVAHRHSYQELATGMHYREGDQWLESEETIEILANNAGAMAAKGQHKVIFPVELKTGIIELQMPDGQWLRSRVWGLAYFDASTGESVLLAEVKESDGQVIGDNAVVYPDAFTDFLADIRYTYTRAGFEQDVVLRAQPPAPEKLGLNPQTTRLQVLTEFIDPIIPTKTDREAGELPDQSLGFGTMTIGSGKAFSVDAEGESAGPVPVAKQWEQLEGRDFLIEEVRYEKVADELQKLPEVKNHDGASLQRRGSGKNVIAGLKKILPKRFVQTTPKPANKRMARARPNLSPSFVMDYLIVTSETNFTFKGDTTYSITGTVNLSGTTTFEGGTVIKYYTNATTLNILGTINCQTAPYRPAVFTTFADNTVGEIVPGPASPCSGPFTLNVINYFEYDIAASVYDDAYEYLVSDATIAANDSDSFGFTAGLQQHFGFYAYDQDFYAYEFEYNFWPTLQNGTLTIDGDGNVSYSESGSALCTPPASAPTVALTLANGGTVHDLRIRHLGIGIASAANYSMTNVQFLNCSNALKTTSASFYAGNILMTDVAVAFDGVSYTGVVEHLTYDQGTQVSGGTGSSTLSLINSLLTGVPSYGVITPSVNYTDKLSSSAGIYQTVGGGSHYLSATSTNRNLGTTNINAGLLASLAKQTTYAPLALTNVTFTTVTNFEPLVERDTAMPDLGYHYDALDYTFGGCHANSNITFAAGTAVGWFRTSSGWTHAGHGLHIGDNQLGTFAGTGTSPCYWVRLNTVQENDRTAGYGPGGLTGWAGSLANAAKLQMRFTTFSMFGIEANHIRDDWGTIDVVANHCEFYGGGLGAYVSTYALTNCLMVRASVGIEAGNTNYSTFNAWQNCTFRGGLFFSHRQSANVGRVKLTALDTSFDDTVIDTADAYYANGALTHFNYNAYRTNANRTTPTGANDVLVTNFNWRTSWLGSFYLPTNSSLINTGSVAATSIGLYHFTTQTNQVKETNSTVDIGYHYVATDSSGKFFDTDGDGTPDYLEDADGDGVVDAGESLWGLAILTQPQSQSASAGSSVTLSVMAGGISPLRYQWRFNNVNIAGATNSSLPYNPVSPTNAGPYSVVVTNVQGAVTSSPAILTVTCVSPPSGLVGWWQGEFSIYDSISNNHGYLINGGYTNGYQNKGFRFSSAATNYATIPDASSLRPANFTLEAWVYPITSASGYRTVILKGRAADSHSFALYSQGGDSYPTVEIYTSTYLITKGTNTVPLNQWSHLAGTYNGTHLILYVNGVESNHELYSGSVSYAEGPLFIGGNTVFTGGEYFNGQIDEAAVYNRALSATEIRNLYLAGSIGKCPPTPKIIPSHLNALVGNSATFSVVGSGATPVSYQWRYSSNNIAGATNAILNFTNLQLTNAGNYSVTLSNSQGVITTSEALLVNTCYPAVDVVLVVDRSSSMTAMAGSGMTRIQAAKTACSNFVQNLNFANDMAGLVSFANSTTTDQILTNNKSLLLQKIGQLTTSDGTYMGNALLAAQAELISNRHNSNALPVLVFLTDGEPADSANSILSIATQIKSFGTHIITVGLGTNLFASSTNLLSNMASTPGNFYLATNTIQLTNIYNQIANSVCRGDSNALTVSLISPVNGQSYSWTPTNIWPIASVRGATGEISKLEFFAGPNYLGAATHFTNGTNYTLNWRPVLGGTYQLTAVASAPGGIRATSSVVNITVNHQPTVSITAPTNGSRFFIPSTNLTIAASAADSDGSVTNVEFFSGTNKLGADANSPYTLAWNNVQPGIYTLFARATDNLGATSNSTAVVVTVYQTNAPPVVDAGDDLRVRLPNAVLLAGNVTDDGLPLGSTLTFAWTNVTAPSGAVVVFSNATQLATEAAFTKVGFYTNRLNGSDGMSIGSDDIVIQVLKTNLPPVVSPGQYGLYTDGLTLQLKGFVADDAQPEDGFLVTGWHWVGGPGPVHFGNPTVTNTLVTFSAEGTYELGLTGSDGELSTSSNVTIIVISNSIPYGAADYLYQIVTPGENTGFSDVGYEVDEFWNNGIAAFGTDNPDLCALNNPDVVHTLWSEPNTDLLVRRWFVVPEGTTNLSMGFTVDNSAFVYINGIPITSTNADAYSLTGDYWMRQYNPGGEFYYGTCPTYDRLKLANISTTVWHIGTNLLAVRARAGATPSFFDSRICINSPYVFTNSPPAVFVGPDVYTTVSNSTYIPGFVMDDGRGDYINPFAAWSRVDGPDEGWVYFNNALNGIQIDFTNWADVGVLAVFTKAGTYTLKLEADDGPDYFSEKTLTVFVDSILSPPTITLVSPTNNASFTAGDTIVVTAATSGAITNVQFAAYTATGAFLIGNKTNAPFSINWSSAPPGNYLIEGLVTDEDGLSGVAFSTNVQVFPYNNRPIVAVGPDQFIIITNSATLEGLVADDGWPNEVGVATWTKVSGPGEVHFTYTNALHTNFVSFVFTNYADVSLAAQFSAAGEYVVRLIANDGATTASNQITVIVDSGAQTAPLVNLTSPASSSTYSTGVAIPITAIASTTNGNIASISIYAASESGTMLIGRSTNNPCSIYWTPPKIGSYTCSARALDDSGRQGISTPAFVLVSFAATNNAPVARRDDFEVLVNSKYNVLHPLTNDWDADGNALTITSITRPNNPANQARIINGGKAVSFVPSGRGGDFCYYTISDGHGGAATNFFNVLFLGADAPTVTITNPPSGTVVTAGDWVTLYTSVTPANFQGKVEFLRNGIKLGEITNAPYNLAWRAVRETCDCAIVAQATDIYGQVGTSPELDLIINLPSGTNAAGPFAAFSNLSAVLTNADGHAYTAIPMIREGLFNLTGSAYATNPSVTDVSYAIRVLSVADGSVLRQLTPTPRNANGFHAGAVTNGLLATLDLTTLQNGVYDLSLVVRAGYEETTTVVRFGLDSNLKIGQFSFSEQDLVIPTGGFPLTVTRTYNSLNPNIGEFGYSWTYALNDLDLEIDEYREDIEYLDSNFDGDIEPSGLTFSMRTGGGRNVTLNLPDGRRTTFYYYLEPDTCAEGDPVQACAFPKWQAAPDVRYELTLLDTNIHVAFLLNSGVQWWSDNASSDVENYDFSGFILNDLQDGTEYRIERDNFGSFDFLSGGIGGNYAQAYGKGRLTQITQRNQNKIQVTTNGMFSVDATGVTNRTVKFVRDAGGRITAIYDPRSLDANGNSNAPPAVKYEYAGDNLAYVHRLQNRDNPANPVYLTTTYEYTNTIYPHYLCSIVDPRGITVARNEHDDSGKLTAVVDADGKRTEFHHSTSNKVEIVTDRLGNTNSYVYDLLGNVRFTTNTLKIVTAMGYNDLNHKTTETAVTNALGETTSTWTLYTLDETGRQTNVVSSPNHTNSFLYDKFGNLLWQRDPLGNIATNGYDGFGNLTNTVQLDSSGNPVGGSSSSYVNGHLIATLDFNGKTNSSFAYDPSGNLTNTTDANGVSRRFSYDANGNQTESAYTWTNGVTSKTVTNRTIYDAQGRVTMNIDALGNTNRTFYNALGKVDYTVDKFGNTNSFLYDPRGNLIQTTHADGLTTKTVYDDAGRAYLTTDRNGITATWSYFDAAGRATNVVRRTNVVVTIDAGPISKVSNSGTPISTNATEYLPSGWVKSRTGPNGAKTTYAYWPDGQTMYVTNVYSTNITFYKYDIAGRQEYVADALNRTNRFEYDAAGRMFKTVFHNGTYTSNYFNNLGQRTVVRDQAGRLTQFGYDVSGQLTNVIKPDVFNAATGANGTPQWAYSYDAYGRLHHTTDPMNHSTTNSYDAFGREVTRWLTLGGAGTTNHYNALGQLTNQVDFKGQRKQTRYDRFGRVGTNYYFATPTSAYPSNSVFYYYNPLGQLTNITERWGTDASIGYVASIGLPNGKGRNTRFAALLASLDQVPPGTKGGALGVSLCGLIALAFFTAAARRRRVRTWEFARTVATTLRVQMFSLSAGGEGRGEVARSETQIHFRSLPSAILHLPSSVIALCSFAIYVLRCGGTPDGTPKRFRLPSFGWRFVSIITLVALIGSDPHFDGLWTARAACDTPTNPSVPDNERITIFSYDLEGRLAQVNTPEGVINYEYDLATGRHLRTCTGKSELSYEYDDLGRLWKVNVLKRDGAPVTGETITYTYTAVGSRASIQLPNGVKTSYAYDELNRLTGLTNRASDNSILSQFNYQVDATGRRTNAVEIIKQEDVTVTYQTNTLSWAYDGMYRLTNEVCVSTVSGASYTNAFQYDLTGNRWQKTRKVGAQTETIKSYYNANDQLLREELTELGGTLRTNYYAYDANGSVVAKTNATASTSEATLYGYDLKNKLSSAVTLVGSPYVTNYYRYNESGIRVRTSSSSGGNPTLYLVDGNNHTGYAQVLEELTTRGSTPDRSYVLGDDVLAQTVSGTVRYLLYDGHGSTRQLSPNTANANTVTSRYNYDAYGQTLTATSTSTPQTSLLYCGEQYDANLQMYNLRARYYNPANGTFNQRDNFMGHNEDPQSLHKYAYANGDPVNGMDPTGQFTLFELIVVIAVVFVVTAVLAPSLNKGKQKAQYTMANLSGADDVTNAIKAANIDINESSIQLGEDTHQTFLESLKKQGEYRRQFVRARAGNEILAADANAWLHEGSGIALNVVPGVAEIKAAEAPALFENAFSGFSNGKLGQQAHDAFEEALHSLYGTIRGDWEMRTAPGLTGVDATFVGDMSRFPGFKYGELKPYSQNSLGTFGEQLGRWGLPNGETELFFYNRGGVIGSSGFRF